MSDRLRALGRRFLGIVAPAVAIGILLGGLSMLIGVWGMVAVVLAGAAAVAWLEVK